MNLARRFSALALFAAACGGMHSANDAHTADLTAFGSTGQQLEAAVETYATAASTATDDAACRDAMDQYLAQAQSMLDAMAGQCGWVDGQMMAGASSADTACVAAAMLADMAFHHSAACTGTTDANQAEATRHTELMESCLGHQQARYEQVGTSMGMMTGSAPATWTCVQNADGTFTIDGQPWSPGEPFPGTATTDGTGGTWPMPCGEGGSCDCGGGSGSGSGGMMGGSGGGMM